MMGKRSHYGTDATPAGPVVRRLLGWLNRHPCRCVREEPKAQRLGLPEGYVNVLCRRHALIWWLGERFILLAGGGDYWHTGHIEWRPWYWGKDGYMRKVRDEQRLGLRPSDDEYVRDLMTSLEAQS